MDESHLLPSSHDLSISPLCCFRVSTVLHPTLTEGLLDFDREQIGVIQDLGGDPTLVRCLRSIPVGNMDYEVANGFMSSIYPV